MKKPYLIEVNSLIINTYKKEAFYENNTPDSFASIGNCGRFNRIYNTQYPDSLRQQYAMYTMRGPCPWNCM